MDILQRLSALGIKPPEVLLPAPGISMEKWAVVACDQYTSQPEYWQSVEEQVGNEPSTLRMIVPEAYLDTSKGNEWQAKASRAMADYLRQGVLKNCGAGFVYLHRSTPWVERRQGLVAAMDLDQYEFQGEAMIRPTEKTLPERLPPRMAVRREALLECPHVMVLIDDPDDTVMSAASCDCAPENLLYDFDLMMKSGHLTGWHVSHWEGMAGALEALLRKNPMLYAVGDGNHSLAAAKNCWLEIRDSLSQEERENHPARFALVELVNIHDQGLVFHPIHRVVFGVGPSAFLSALRHELGGSAGGPALRCIYKGVEEQLVLPQNNLPEVCALQAALERVLEQFPAARADYVHGEDVCITLGRREGNISFLLPSFDKSLLFSTVQTLGVLPKKSFSMGEAEEKRFYVECREIK